MASCFHWLLNSHPETHTLTETHRHRHFCKLESTRSQALSVTLQRHHCFASWTGRFVHHLATSHLFLFSKWGVKASDTQSTSIDLGSHQKLLEVTRRVLRIRICSINKVLRHITGLQSSDAGLRSCRLSHGQYKQAAPCVYL